MRGKSSVPHQMQIQPEEKWAFCNNQQLDFHKEALFVEMDCSNAANEHPHNTLLGGHFAKNESAETKNDFL